MEPRHCWGSFRSSSLQIPAGPGPQSPLRPQSVAGGSFPDLPDVAPLLLGAANSIIDIDSLSKPRRIGGWYVYQVDVDYVVVVAIELVYPMADSGDIEIVDSMSEIVTNKIESMSGLTYLIESSMPIVDSELLYLAVDIVDNMCW